MASRDHELTDLRQAETETEYALRVQRLAYGYELMHRAICNMAGTSGADGRWYFEKANEVFDRVSPIFDVTANSNLPIPGDCLRGGFSKEGRS